MMAGRIGIGWLPAALLLVSSGSAVAFAPGTSLLPCMAPRAAARVAPSMRAEPGSSRRRFIGAAAAGVLGVSFLRPQEASAKAAKWYVPPSVIGGGYTGLEWDGPVWAQPADGESVKYCDFLVALKSQQLTLVEFIGPSGENVFATFKDGKRIRVGQGLPDETTPPPPTEECVDCTQYCLPEDKSCSCLSACGGKKGWNSPIYLAKVIRAWKVPFTYVEKAGGNPSGPVNKTLRWMMFDGPMSAGLI
mmetsp:Transcript_65970/g.151194  ORF Transcript_65970/g.151194 Transcript_65970/m.151194 type:complete len:247 (+) Transcript_65970:3-743(+)